MSHACIASQVTADDFHDKRALQEMLRKLNYKVADYRKRQEEVVRGFEEWKKRDKTYKVSEPSADTRRCSWIAVTLTHARV